MAVTAHRVSTTFPNGLAVCLKGGQGQAVVGPILFGGARFDCLVTETLLNGMSNPNPGKLGVYKSTDTGVNWSELDAAHAPLVDYEGDTWFNVQAFYPAEGGRYVYFVYQVAPDDFTDTMVLIQFDLQTGLWGTPSVEGPQLAVKPGQGSPFAQLVVRTNGDQVILYEDFNLSQVAYVIYSGAWGAPVAITGAPFGSSAVAAQRDPFDSVMFFWNNGNSLNVNTLSSGNVLSAAAFTGWNLSSSLLDTSYPIWIPGTSQFAIALADISGSTIKVVKCAANLSAFSIELVVSSSVQSPRPSYPRLALSGTSLYLVYVNYDDTGFNFTPPRDHLILRCVQTVGASTWGAPVQLFDSLSDTFSPNPHPFTSPNVYNAAFTIYPDGTQAFSLGTVDDNGAFLPSSTPNDFGNQQYYFEIPPATTPTTITLAETLGITASFAFGTVPLPPPPPPPPPFCIINPTPGTGPTAIVYNEPLEKQGS